MGEQIGVYTNDEPTYTPKRHHMSWGKVIQLSEKGQLKQQLLALFAW